MRRQNNNSNTLPFTRKKSRNNPANPQSGAIEQSLAGVDLAAAAELIKQLPEVNATRVVALHDRIQRGEYSPDAAGIAAKLLAFENQLENPRDKEC